MCLKEDRWVLFDFCETLVNFQTADAFVDFVCRNRPKFITSFVQIILRILNRAKLFVLMDRIVGRELFVQKKCKLRLLRGCSEEDIETLSKMYYATKIKPNLIKTTCDLLREFKNNGYRILIVSGGYSVYIQHFAHQFGVDGIIANKIKFVRGKCEGCLEGINCMNENKQVLLNAYFNIKPTYCIAYSDSVSDIPFLNWADKGVVVSKNKHQLWVNTNIYDEIVWS